MVKNYYSISFGDRSVDGGGGVDCNKGGARGIREAIDERRRRQGETQKCD